MVLDAHSPSYTDCIMLHWQDCWDSYLSLVSSLISFINSPLPAPLGKLSWSVSISVPWCELRRAGEVTWCVVAVFKTITVVTSVQPCMFFHAELGVGWDRYWHRVLGIGRYHRYRFGIGICNNASIPAPIPRYSCFLMWMKIILINCSLT